MRSFSSYLILSILFNLILAQGLSHLLIVVVPMATFIILSRTTWLRHWVVSLHGRPLRVHMAYSCSESVHHPSWSPHVVPIDNTFVDTCLKKKI